MSALDDQVAGNHYLGFDIQPAMFIDRNNIGFLPGNVIKRMCRFKLKGEPLKDLRKAQHEIELIIQLNGYEGERGKDE